MGEPVIGKRARFVESLVGGADVGAAARAAGRCERTGARWLCDADVRAVLSEMQGARLRALNARMIALATDSLDVLGALLSADGEPVADYVRLGAVKVALDSALRLSEYTDIEARLLEVERALAERR